MLRLALDTASPAVTVAVCADAEVCAERTVVDARRHGELVSPLIGAALADAGVMAADLQAVVVGVGPGPFTGLRVGLMTALALGDALGVSVCGLCSLDALAGDEPDVVAVTDARRREVYWARYAVGRRVAGPHVDRPADLAARLSTGALLRGPGADAYADVFAGAAPDARIEPGGQIRAAALGRLAAAGAQPLPVVPLYLRRPDAVAPAGRKAVSLR